MTKKRNYETNESASTENIYQDNINEIFEDDRERKKIARDENETSTSNRNPKETILTVSRFNNPGNLSSWIWQWGKHSKDGNYTIFTCKVNVDGIDCNYICRGKGSSTSNAGTHL